LVRLAPECRFDVPENASSVESPEGFATARICLEQTMSACRSAGVPDAAVLAALMTEAIPRLVGASGPRLAAATLRRLAACLEDEARPAYDA